MHPIEILGIGIVLLIIYYLYKRSFDQLALPESIISAIIAGASVSFLMTTKF